MIVIGLTGKNCAGKGEVAKYLTERSFTYFSLSDVIREELKKMNLPPTREEMINLGNKLRLQKGNGVLAQEISRKLSRDKNYIIDSIRNPAEVEVLSKNHKNFTLIEVTAPPKIRFERMSARRRPGDPENIKDFLEFEKRETEKGEENYQQLGKCAVMADIRVENKGDISALHGEISEIVSKILKKDTRPSWDVYFMDIAQSVATRSNCMKRQIAALIVRNNRIIATGYNGTPSGIENCIEGGCPRCASLARSGTRLSECLCSHAEENAITQSARYGIAVEAATIYTTFSPCLICSKMIINSGIREVIYSHTYPMDDVSSGILHEAGVVIRQYES